MFIGEYITQLGDKNRIAIPKKLRENFKGQVYITRGYENCLLMTDFKRWNLIIDEINKSPLFSLGNRELKRYILGGANEIEYDGQGRFVLSEALKKFSEIETQIIFIGVGEWIEIWNAESWNLKIKDLKTNISDISENLYKDNLIK